MDGSLWMMCKGHLLNTIKAQQRNYWMLMRKAQIFLHSSTIYIMFFTSVLSPSILTFVKINSGFTALVLMQVFHSIQYCYIYRIDKMSRAIRWLWTSLKCCMYDYSMVQSCWHNYVSILNLTSTWHKGDLLYDTHKNTLFIVWQQTLEQTINREGKQRWHHRLYTLWRCSYNMAKDTSHNSPIT